MKRLTLIIITVLVVMSLFSFSLIAQAQDNVPAVAAVQNGNVVITGSTPVTVTNPPNKGFLSLAWNPGATKLAYIMNDEQYNRQIAVVDANGGKSIILNTGKLEDGFPVSWTPDGQVMFVKAGDPTDGSKPYMVTIERVAPVVDATPETIGTFAMGEGCGGGSILPGDWLYSEEAGFGGDELLLQYTDYGILHSSVCSGGGLALYAPQGGQDTPLTGDNFLQPTPDRPQQQIARAKLSNDGKTLAGIRSTYAEPTPARELVLIDLSTQEIKPVTTAAEPDQLEWSPGGGLFYSTRTQKGYLDQNLTAEQKTNVAKIFGSSDIQVPTDEVSIHMLNLSTGEDKVIYTASAYAIGKMVSTIDGQSLIFSQIANMDKWVEGMANGTLDVLNDTDNSAQRATVPVLVFKLPLGGGDPVLVGENLSMFELKS